jgi:hypothetical protein
LPSPDAPFPPVGNKVRFLPPSFSPPRRFPLPFRGAASFVPGSHGCVLPPGPLFSSHPSCPAVPAPFLERVVSLPLSSLPLPPLGPALAFPRLLRSSLLASFSSCLLRFRPARSGGPRNPSCSPMQPSRLRGAEFCTAQSTLPPQGAQSVELVYYGAPPPGARGCAGAPLWALRLRFCGGRRRWWAEGGGPPRGGRGGGRPRGGR